MRNVQLSNDDLNTLGVILGQLSRQLQEDAHVLKRLSAVSWQHCDKSKKEEPKQVEVYSYFKQVMNARDEVKRKVKILSRIQHQIKSSR